MKNIILINGLSPIRLLALSSERVFLFKKSLAFKKNISIYDIVIKTDKTL